MNEILLVLNLQVFFATQYFPSKIWNHILKEVYEKFNSFVLCVFPKQWDKRKKQIKSRK